MSCFAELAQTSTGALLCTDVLFSPTENAINRRATKPNKGWSQQARGLSVVMSRRDYEG
ncbi:hypothetical protein CBM2634_U120001 [Cupriavidus taiwanensis]|uniref:Uncharacterized protein n=2 Tax=Cupriavidus taiwanensis TaxID=164546 RepID=A0A375JBK3_9BURK|nr:hypothetical protein CBM2634_U120001 [Cupriavidus taiwanensis]